MSRADWETVIGLEIHVQLATQSKIFSPSSIAYGAAANAQANAIDLGLPGVLPVLNREAVRLAVVFGLAIGASIAARSVFARKNYFYPDLPKGYQISQFELPIVGRGEVVIRLADGSEKPIGITRAHLEEDAGKSSHEDVAGMTAIDLNRAGTPLLEIVSEPDLRSAGEAAAYMRKIHTLVRYLGISDGNMQEGSFRADANVSVRRRGQSELGTRTELKNINSFRFVEKAIEFEAERQIELIEGGGAVTQQTRLYDPERDQTRSMRSKEDSNDYRYFPDPDLLPVEIDAAFLDRQRERMPELPDARERRYRALGLRPESAEQLASGRAAGDYYDTLLGALGDDHAKLAANWVGGELSAALKRDGVDVDASRVPAAQLAGLLKRVADGTVSGSAAKQVFETLWQHRDNDGAADAADRLIAQLGLTQVSDGAELEAAVERLLADNPEQVAQYRAGKTKVKGFFVGQIMKQFKGKANPQRVSQLVEQKLA